MKKHLSLFVPLMALFLTLAPQTAKAGPIDPTSTTKSTPFTLYHTGDAATSGKNFGRFEIAFVGSWGNVAKPILEYRTLNYDGTEAEAWRAITTPTSSTSKVTIKTTKCSSGSTYFVFTDVNQNTAYASAYAIQFRLKNQEGNAWRVNKTHYITFKFRYNYQYYAPIGLTGNIMSLVSSNFADLTEFPEGTDAGCFYKLFSDDTSDTHNVNIECNNLLLPATTLKNSCYEDMFSGCAGFLTKGPNIMAFNPETDCATDCFKNMFNGCSNMTQLTTNFLSWGTGTGTTNWLNGCTKCTTVNCPADLDVTQKDANHIGTNYSSGSGNVTPDVYVFNVAEKNGTWTGGCTADKYYTTAAPSVPDPVGTPSFAGWYSEDCILTDISGLSAPTGIKYYYAEFTGSVTVPYTITFKAENGDVLQTKNCRPGHIPSYTGSTDISRAGYVPVWSPAIVAATGNAEYQVTYVEPNFFTIKNTGNADKSVTIRKGKGTTTQPKFTYRVYYANGTIKTTWTDITISNTTGTSITVPANGGKIQIYGDNATLGTGTGDYTKFNFAQSSSFEISGNILSLVSCKDGTNFDENFDMLDYCFYGLFSDNIGTSNATHPVVDAKELELPSSTVSSYGYALMFSNCKGLKNAPQSLPATDLGTNCYYQMFYQCLALSSAPYSLPAESLPNYCYREMFYYCSSLKKAPDIYSTSYGTSSLLQMFDGCSQLTQIRSYYDGTWGTQTKYWVRGCSETGAFYCPPTLALEWGAATSSGTGYNKIPRDVNKHWTVYSYDVTFKVKAGGNWIDGSHFDWKEDVSVITDFLDAENTAKTEFFTDADCAEAHKVSITDIENDLPRTTTPQPAKTYYMRRKVVTYTLDWSTNGGSELTGTYTSGSVEAGDAITAPTDPTKSGFVFTGWKDENGNDFTGVMPAANTTYTAQWKHNYTITTTCSNGSVTLTASGYAAQVGSGTYLEGTILTMNVTLDDGYRFVRWNDNDTQNPRAIEVSDNASYTAVTEVIPTHWARFYDDDGTTLKYEVQVREGSAISYGGAEPDKYGYVFDGWSSAIGVMGDDDVTFTATYATEPNFFTIKNTHVSAATNVSMVRNDANSPTPTLYIRIYDANNTLQTGWTPITVNSSPSSSKLLGSIPHGGKMQIYGITGTELAYTTNMDYWIRFSFSGGTPEVSGNILSLTSCSADRKTIGTVNTWPEYYFTNLFYSCSSLVSAENLEMPATTVGNSACRYMFGGCTSLTKAPKTLPAATIDDYSYMFMFHNCSTLVKSPDIHATNITTSGHYSMFLNCVALRQIRTYNTIWETTQIKSSFTDWVKNTTLGGAFYCPPTLPRESANFGTYGIPVYSSARWLVYSYDVTFVPLECTWSSAPNSGNRQFTWETDVVNVTNFLTAESAANAQFYESDGTTPVSAETIISRLSSETSARTYKVRKVSSYTLAWDANGGELDGTAGEDYTAAGSYSAGAEITAPNAIRAGYTYTWDPDFTGTMPAANTTYTAQWTQKSYTLNATASAGGSGVTRSDNGNSETVKRYGDNVVLTPVANTGYHFTGWTGTDAGDLTDNGNGTYTLTIADKADNYEYAVTANFAPNTHRLTWTTDGNTLTGDYTHGEAIAYGTTIIAPNTPTKNATAQYTYTFNGWEPALDATMPDNDVTYTATWTETKRQYTLAWDVNGGNALTGTYTYGTIDWGTDIVKPANPTKDGYAFNGWDADNDGKADEVAKTMPTTSLTYKAIWVAELPNITLCENCNNDHYNTFKSDYDGETVNVTYPRQFAANRWSTMCLPFSIELPEMIAQKMYGRVYEFKYATGNANTNSGVNLYFSNAKKIEAGKCYIVNANDALAAKTSFVFSGVTIDLSKDNGADLSSPETPEASVAAYNALPGDKSEGTIELVGTLRNGILMGTATGNKYMGLKENKIYYPNISQGSTIWAYRGIFRSTETLNIEKMRIVVDGEDKGEIRIDNGELIIDNGSPVRKFIRNGNLYIEREGVVYDAQGKRVEGAF